MESFHTTQKLCFTMLGLGMMASAHATTISCDQEFKTDGEIVVVENSIVCNTTTSPNDYAILISGNNIKFDLNGNSITAEVNNEPDEGILITGDGNHVLGPGTIEGFDNGNIQILNADNNHVNNLHLVQGSNFGVGVIAIGAGEQANGNYISHNIIDNSGGIGIDLGSVNNGVILENHVHHNQIQDTELDGIVIGLSSNNHIHDNSIQRAGRGISVLGQNGSSNGNQIYGNHIKDTESEGILVFSGSTPGNADSNQIYNNKIEKAGTIGISLFAFLAVNTTNQNLIFYNQIIQPGEQAIALGLGGSGSVSLNSITYNFAKDVIGQAYCDNSGMFNNWGINFNGLSAEFGTPGLCV